MLFQKLKAKYDKDGFREAFLWAIVSAHKKTTRKIMPKSNYIKYNGIDIGKKKRLGDDFILSLYPLYLDGDISTYEDGLVKALSDNVYAGDKVVVVGGGVGVTVIHAALKVGACGRVDCFEGNIEGVESVKRTAERNAVSTRVHVHHAIVGESIGVYGDSSTADQISPLNLPVCDVLELDCEGSEIGILSQISFRPRCIAVETHGFLGAPTSEVHKLLVNLGYTLQNLGPAEPHLSEICISNDVMVLVGVFDRANG